MSMRSMTFQSKIIALICVSAAIVFLAGTRLLRHLRKIPADTKPAAAPMNLPVRAEPERFRSNTNLPPKREGLVSGSINLKTFLPEKNLVHIDDKRVWWESDHDTNDDEDDHIIHKSMKIPLRRLIELVCQNNGTLEVHDAYRPKGIHNPRSLHKEGRAIDVTCDQFPLEKLAKICWASGFDWVYFESKSKNGAHVHCSVKR